MFDLLKYRVHLKKEDIKGSLNRQKFCMAASKSKVNTKVYFRLVRDEIECGLGENYIIFINNSGGLVKIPSMCKKEYREIVNLMYTQKKGYLSMQPRFISAALRVPAAPKNLDFERAVSNGCAMQLMQLDRLVNC